jgi:hypothetical protein
VRSCTLDDWGDADVAGMRGNAAVNAALEHRVPEGVYKPHFTAPRDVREPYIRRKYIERAFAQQPGVAPLAPQWSAPVIRQSASAEGGLVAQVDWAGSCMIQVVRGRDLLVADITGASDPYCVISNGIQTVRTKTIRNTVNPVWNARLSLNVLDVNTPLSLEVSVNTRGRVCVCVRVCMHARWRCKSAASAFPVASLLPHALDHPLGSLQPERARAPVPDGNTGLFPLRCGTRTR